MRYQQSLKSRTISIVTLNSILVDLPGIEPLVPQVLAALENLKPGDIHYPHTLANRDASAC